MVCSCKAVFLDNNALFAPDSRVGDLMHTTSRIVRQDVETSGIREDQLGAVPASSEASLPHPHNRKEIEILIADRSQGSDSELGVIWFWVLAPWSDDLPHTTD